MKEPLFVLAFPQLEGVHGIARYVRSFIAAYPSDAPPLLLIAGNRGPELDVPPNVSVEYIPVPDNRFGLFKWGRIMRKRLIALARERSIAAINVHIPPMIPVLLVPKVAPIVVTAHTTYLGMSGEFYPTRHFESDWRGVNLKIKKLMERVIFSRASAILTLTDQGKQEVTRYGYEGPIDILPNGVDLSRFQPGLESKVYDVIFAGRIEKRKGSRPMVEVIKRLVAARPAIKIVVVGYGEDDEYVRSELGAYSSSVLLTGKIPFDEVSALFDKSRVYASTSYYEGLPGTCIEAMAMQLPAVVWDFPFYEALVQSEITGRLVEPNNFDLFVDRTLGLLDDEETARRMALAGRDLVMRTYDWKILAPKIVSVFMNRGQPALAGK